MSSFSLSVITDQSYSGSNFIFSFHISAFISHYSFCLVAFHSDLFFLFLSLWFCPVFLKDSKETLRHLFQFYMQCEVERHHHRWRRRRLSSSWDTTVSVWRCLFDQGSGRSCRFNISKLVYTTVCKNDAPINWLSPLHFIKSPEDHETRFFQLER